MAYVVHQKVLFKHCDPAGIVFYPRYFEMINDCVEAFFCDVVKVPFEELLVNAGVPTAQISADFTAPSRHGDQLEIRVNPKSVGRSSLQLEFVGQCSEQARFTANARLVYTDAAGKSAPWPDDMRARINGAMEEAK
ncbi:acyl-CoA thioesterase [Flexibacterium corallicola]|uniref:acyl-CoA thioesterase n=1 Tax=Flexibacterium corallicola TaxID=3037259 RepID=UPI00286F0B4A|nr:thioesterase family protein [Pseudovibrio sp. M1P-2-3]